MDTTVADILERLKKDEERSIEYGFTELGDVYEFIESLTKMFSYRKYRLEKIETLNIYVSEDESFSWYIAVSGSIDNRFFSYTFHKAKDDGSTSFQIPHTCDVPIDELIKTIEQYESLNRW